MDDGLIMQKCPGFYFFGGPGPAGSGAVICWSGLGARPTLRGCPVSSFFKGCHGGWTG